MSSRIWSQAIKGWLAGCGAATAVISTLIVLAIVYSDKLPGSVGGGLLFLLSAVLIFVIICVLTAIPAALVIWLSEKFGIRSILYFGCTGAVTGALGDAVFEGSVRPWSLNTVWPFVVAGFVAGMAYWRIAGRHAGRDREVSVDSA
jgi:hypothetical protein